MSKKAAGRRGQQGPRRRKRPVAVGPDMVVTVTYRLFDSAGELRDRISPREPLRFLHGHAQVIPGLEERLSGARAGERRSFWLHPHEAFGERDENARLEIDRSELPGEVSVGDEIVAEAPDGSELVYRICEVGDDDIVADLNHPLAGERVRFEVEVLDVRPATDEEIDAALAELDERIADANTTVYGSSDAGLEPSEEASGEAVSSSGLVQLRRKPSDRT